MDFGTVRRIRAIGHDSDSFLYEDFKRLKSPSSFTCSKMSSSSSASSGGSTPPATLSATSKRRNFVPRTDTLASSVAHPNNNSLRICTHPTLPSMPLHWHHRCRYRSRPPPIRPAIGKTGSHHRPLHCLVPSQIYCRNWPLINGSSNSIWLKSPDSFSRPVVARV